MTSFSREDFDLTSPETISARCAAMVCWRLAEEGVPWVISGEGQVGCLNTDFCSRSAVFDPLPGYGGLLGRISLWEDLDHRVEACRAFPDGFPDNIVY